MRAVVDVIGELVRRTSERVQQKHGFEVFYQFGHLNDILEILLSYSGTAEFRKKKYPAVFLIQNFVERTGTRLDLQCEADLHLVIVAPSAPAYRPEERQSKVFKPVLYPIYEALMRCMERSGDLIDVPRGGLAHEKIDSPKGSELIAAYAQKSPFNDHLDAIWLRGVKIRVLKQQCITN
jgi:hypothetical protein